MHISIRRKKNFEFFRKNRLNFFSKQHESALQQIEQTDLQMGIEAPESTTQHGKMRVQVKLEADKYRISIDSVELDRPTTTYEFVLKEAWKKPLKELKFIFRSLTDNLMDPSTDAQTRLKMVIFAQNIVSQLKESLSKEDMCALFTFEQASLLVDFLGTLSKNEAKVTFWMLHLLLKMQVLSGLLRPLFRKLIRITASLLSESESLRVFEIICDFILFWVAELSFAELKQFILDENSTFVSLLMSIDLKINKMIQANLEVGFKGICTASAICSTGAQLKLLTSAQNCFVNALTIFRCLGISTGKDKGKLSKNELVFTESLIENPQNLKSLLQFFLTYVYLVDDQVKIADLYLKNLTMESILLMFRYSAMEVRKYLLVLLSNTFIELPMLQSQG